MFRCRIDRLVGRLLGALAASSCALVVLIVVFLAANSAPALVSIGPRRMWSDSSWHPAETGGRATFGMAPLVAGTLAVTCGATMLAAPLALASALFCQFYAPRHLATVYRRMVELLAGVPSVVFGFWGLVVLAPLLARWKPPGLSLLAGVLIVALMILPTIMLVVDAALAAVPRAHLLGASALGLGRWSVIRHIAIPAARHGVATGLVLGTARAVGETMAVVMVCGNVIQVPHSMFDPVRTLTANIALEMGYALGDHRAALFVSGLLLLVIAIVLVLVSEGFRRRRGWDGPEQAAGGATG